jgi:hypothetical protein
VESKEAPNPSQPPHCGTPTLPPPTNATQSAAVIDNEVSPQRDLRRPRPSCRRARGSRNRKHPATPPHPTRTHTRYAVGSPARHSICSARFPVAGAALLAWETLPALYPTVEHPPLTSVVRFGVRFAHRSSARIAWLINLCWHPFARSVAAAAPATGFMSLRGSLRFPRSRCCTPSLARYGRFRAWGREIQPAY